MHWLRLIILRWLRLIVIVITGVGFLIIAVVIDRIVTPTIAPGRFTFGALVERPDPKRFAWARGSPRVFVRYIDRSPTFTDAVAEFVTGQRRGVIGQEYITGALVPVASEGLSGSARTVPVEFEVVVTDVSSCEQHKPHIPNAPKEEWDNIVLDPFQGVTDRLIHYVSDAPPIELGTVLLPPPKLISVARTRLIGHTPTRKDPVVASLEIRCRLAVEPQRASYSQYRMQFDTIFREDKLEDTRLDYPRTLIISPPWNSTDWKYDGGTQSEAPLKYQETFTDPDGTLVGNRDDHVRSDFPSKNTLLSPHDAPTVRVTWTYDDAVNAREFSLVLAAGLVGIPMLIAYELIKGRLQRRGSTPPVT